MAIGNWFCAQGLAYVTIDGKFICNDPYVNGLEHECSINDINWCMVEDMMRMTSSTRTHYYMRILLNLPCFHGTERTGIIQKPLRDFEWDSNRWATAYQEESNSILNYQDSDSRIKLRFMRKEVFQHTVFLVQQGFYYTKGGSKVSFPDSRPMMENSAFYSQKIALPPHPTYEQSEIRVENMNCLTAAIE